MSPDWILSVGGPGPCWGPNWGASGAPIIIRNIALGPGSGLQILAIASGLLDWVSPNFGKRKLLPARLGGLPAWLGPTRVALGLRYLRLIEPLD